MLGLVRDMRYFVLHAPRQTGKTSALLALRDLLNAGATGDLHCVYVNVEAAQALREDVKNVLQVIVGEVASRARASGDGFLYDAWLAIFASFGSRALQEALSRCAEESPKPSRLCQHLPERGVLAAEDAGGDLELQNLVGALVDPAHAHVLEVASGPVPSRVPSAAPTRSTVALRNEVQPPIQPLVPALIIDVALVVVSYEPEHDVNTVRVPSWRGAHSNLAQLAQRLSFVAPAGHP